MTQLVVAVSEFALHAKAGGAFASVPAKGRALGSCIEEAVAQLELAPTNASVNLVARLGLYASRIGVMQVTTPVRADQEEGIVKAWATQVWGARWASQHIRWKKLPRNRSLLVTGVEVDVFTALKGSAMALGLRFVSCLPAPLGVVGSHNREERLAVWTEPAQSAPRSSRVHFSHHRAGQPCAMWHGWVPNVESDSDTELMHALRRFKAAHGIGEAVQVSQTHWDPDAS